MPVNFLTETEMAGTGWEDRWVGTLRSRQGENHNLNILYEKNSFSIKGKYVSLVHW